MSMFRLVENTPDTYVSQSRDFQLLCNIFDLVQNSTKHQVDSMIHMLDTRVCSDRLLPLLQAKVGFFTSNTYIYSAEVLRTVLTAFAGIRRYKGSLTGIKRAINVFIHTLQVDGVYKIDITRPSYALYDVRITSSYKFSDRRILNDILSYVIPAGFTVTYETLISPPDLQEHVTQVDSANILEAADQDNRQIYTPCYEHRGYTRNNLFNISGTSTATVYKNHNPTPEDVESDVNIL